MSLLFFALALLFYIRLKDGDNHTSTRILFWALAILNVWIHLFAAIPIGLMCIDLLLDKRNWLCGIVAGMCSLPLVGMLVNVLNTRTHNMYNYGASMLQMVVLTPMEFFNSLFLNIIALAGVGAWFDRNPIKNNLIIITIITLIVGVIGSCYTPFFPRYYMTTALIIILMGAVGIVELTEMLNKKVGKNLDYIILVMIFMIFVLMEWDNLVSHYTIMQYGC